MGWWESVYFWADLIQLLTHLAVTLVKLRRMGVDFGRPLTNMSYSAEPEKSENTSSVSLLKVAVQSKWSILTLHSQRRKWQCEKRTRLSKNFSLIFTQQNSHSFWLVLCCWTKHLQNLRIILMYIIATLPIQHSWIITISDNGPFGDRKAYMILWTTLWNPQSLKGDI